MHLCGCGGVCVCVCVCVLLGYWVTSRRVCVGVCQNTNSFVDYFRVRW